MNFNFVSHVGYIGGTSLHSSAISCSYRSSSNNRRHDNLCLKVSSVFASSQLSSGQRRSFTNCSLFKTGGFVLLLYAFRMLCIFWP
ncbi:hypothetical protein L3X38_024187 [Prunus dulcis]|uniref:Uncharacterized protein n=1 Tax=Prunus dulcis TaxID=3755 RepID=A0AAD4W0X9_PRUDU|nr:hypothetical protein L3X38_024187 [Prunus dulcis]